ncbi:dTDP-4-dehydrorhamnose 3,5-epimerase [Loktanella sp. PT4BL]|jgi:dTDP-4-dehydrorhamnose 3,5-epimerase|uniref:dTDP-4-dehydrorhamnose 3,5-epimerase n=1 Tax=Loktanella sp. PT4BL TaxID=2135611 RepID=UPI000D75F68D|nr:dTDP-4-dehydrorhamnose 3,5-epimerase [Loktanella sp. PT4BL]PXW72238.1 dTDP-4-dehydrorhamnose 3,5-epimerase [Loktanella sp. PT4BL]
MLNETNLPTVMEITPRRFVDSRGHFSETYNADTLAQHGITTQFVQDNQSYSRDIGTVRGLHFQAPPSAQAKLIRVLQGAIWDVAVDIRKGSPTYGQWVGCALSAEKGNQLFIPEGFLHGFVTRTADCIVAYKCSATYAPATEGSVRFDDPDLAIDWGIDVQDAVLSDKDAAAPSFAGFTSPFTYKDAT